MKIRVEFGSRARVLSLTWTNSMGVYSPAGRLTDTVVAGKALGVTCIELRFRGFVMVRDETVTGRQS